MTFVVEVSRLNKLNGVADEHHSPSTLLVRSDVISLAHRVGH